MFFDAPKILLATAASAALLLAHPVILAKPPSKPPGQMGNENSQKPDVPPGQTNELRNPYFGDLHVHTARSLDAGLQGVITTPEQAYEYAKGKKLEILGGSRVVKLSRPMDFAAVTDHAEYFGNFALCDSSEVYDAGGTLQKNPIYGVDTPLGVNCVELREATNAAFALTFALSWLPEIIAGNAGYCTDPELQAILGIKSDVDACWWTTIDPFGNPAVGVTPEGASITGFWTEAQAAADAANDPGRFTAFKAWEWTGGPLSANLHRNIIFRSSNVPERPISFFEAPYRDQIWDQLESAVTTIGGEDSGCTPEGGEGVDPCNVLVIPHNSNLSQGRMFETEGRIGRPFNRNYASRLADYERLVEIMQHKGQSECLTEKKVVPSKVDYPGRLSNEDEYCDFEIVSWATLAGELFNGTPKPQDFVRDALKVGMQWQKGNSNSAQQAVNPFKYGIIASTDTHQGTPGMTREDIHPGHGGGGALFEEGECDPEIEDPTDPNFCDDDDDVGNPKEENLPKGLADTPEYGPGGLAVVWAESNTRDDIFAALQRKEVYGTSGTRMTVRFFGGDLPDDLCELKGGDAIATAYRDGVPMGGTLDGDTPPKFLVSALMAPGEPAAQIKGQKPAAPTQPGTRLQQIQIVKGWVDDSGTHEQLYRAVAGDETNSASVNTETCEPINRRDGHKSLCAVWEDPDYIAGQNAFYYARVLENPVCRWSTHQCNAAGINDAFCATATDATWEDPDIAGYRKCCPFTYPADCENSDDAPAECRNEKLDKTIQERAWTTPIWIDNS